MGITPHAMQLHVKIADCLAGSPGAPSEHRQSSDESAGHTLPNWNLSQHLRQLAITKVVVLHRGNPGSIVGQQLRPLMLAVWLNEQALTVKLFLKH